MSCNEALPTRREVLQQIKNLELQIINLRQSQVQLNEEVCELKNYMQAILHNFVEQAKPVINTGEEEDKYFDPLNDTCDVEVVDF